MGRQPTRNTVDSHPHMCAWVPMAGPILPRATCTGKAADAERPRAHKFNDCGWGGWGGGAQLGTCGSHDVGRLARHGQRDAERDQDDDAGHQEAAPERVVVAPVGQPPLPQHARCAAISASGIVYFRARHARIWCSVQVAHNNVQDAQQCCAPLCHGPCQREGRSISRSVKRSWQWRGRCALADVRDAFTLYARGGGAPGARAFTTCAVG